MRILEAYEATRVNLASKPKKNPFNKMPPCGGIIQTVRNLGIQIDLTKVLKATQK